MASEEMWSLDCDKCGKEIQKPVNWFRESCCCPHCEAELNKDKVKELIERVQKELDGLTGEIDFNF